METAVQYPPQKDAPNRCQEHGCSDGEPAHDVIGERLEQHDRNRSMPMLVSVPR